MSDTSKIPNEDEQEWYCTLHDITFHHLHEEETYSHSDLKKQYLSLYSKNTNDELMRSFQLKPKIALKCNISKFGFHSSISKALKKKY